MVSAISKFPFPVMASKAAMLFKVRFCRKIKTIPNCPNFEFVTQGGFPMI